MWRTSETNLRRLLLEVTNTVFWEATKGRSNGLVHSVFFLPAGLKQIHALTIQANYELRIDLEDFENSTAYAQYGTFGVGLFSVDPDDDGYPLTVGDYSGNAGN